MIGYSHIVQNLKHLSFEFSFSLYLFVFLSLFGLPSTEGSFFEPFLVFNLIADLYQIKSNRLCELHLLRIELSGSQGAEVKQSKYIDLEELVSVQHLELVQKLTCLCT